MSDDKDLTDSEATALAGIAMFTCFTIVLFILAVTIPMLIGLWRWALG